MMFGLKTKECTHVPETLAEAREASCEGCGSGFNLRMCAECGFVGCCESQRGHDREHALGTGHPVILSMPVTPSSFTWCYECRRYI